MQHNSFIKLVEVEMLNVKTKWQSYKIENVNWAETKFEIVSRVTNFSREYWNEEIEKNITKQTSFKIVY